jgi:hypothetical protein
LHQCSLAAQTVSAPAFDLVSLPFSLKIIVNRSSVKLQLPDTHGIIFRWDPPSFGIPVPVLEQLADELMKKASKVVKDKAGVKYIPPSQQSSPTLSDDETEQLLPPTPPEE